MTSHPPEDSAIVERARTGDAQALGAAFDAFRPRLKMMVRLRLHPTLRRRVDASDVLQEAYVELARQLPSYAEKQPLPFFLWIRRVTGQRLAQVHRRHFGAEKRDPTLEVFLQQEPMPQAGSQVLADQLLASMTSVSQKAIRAEACELLRQSLERLDPLDREILALRHFEELTNLEAATELGIETSAASKRYFRALRRLRGELAKIPGLLPDA
ncbi:MAG: sigma-70 family RNA polymerase sigma factor [Planctomycetota bacterium]